MVSIAIWDFGKGAPKGTREESKQINAYLDEVRLALGNCYKELLLKGKLVTAKAVKNLYLGETDETFSSDYITEAKQFRPSSHTLFNLKQKLKKIRLGGQLQFFT